MEGVGGDAVGVEVIYKDEEWVGYKDQIHQNSGKNGFENSEKSTLENDPVNIFGLDNDFSKKLPLSEIE